MITTLIVLVFTLLGLIVGSFLNVVICRLGTNKGFGGRSFCMSCSQRIAWHDLVPVLSYVCLLGRCRHCKSRISAQYPLVEMATGIVFGLLSLKFMGLFFYDTMYFIASYAFYAAMFCLLVVITAYDIRHKIIPDALAIILGVFAFAGLFLFRNYIFFPHLPSVGEFLAGAVVSVPFALLWLVSRGRWMGLGDAKLMVGLGWLLGISGAVTGTVIAFWAGAIFGVVALVLSRRHKWSSEVPFAPFLVLGAFLTFIFGISIFPL